MHVKLTNGNVDTYPYNVGKLRRENSNTSFPKLIPDEMLAEWGVYPVIVTDMPSYTERTQVVTQDATPTGSGSSWTIGWAVSNKTAEEVQQYDENIATSNRRIRNSRLAETDYFALTDVTISDAMTAYRQALRDLPSHSNWPNLESGDWPTEP
jgi:hypothetical protein